jgi:hypothetical protein
MEAALTHCRPFSQLVKAMAQLTSAATADADKWSAAKAAVTADIDKAAHRCLDKVKAAATAAKKKDSTVMSSLQQILQASLRSL